MIRAILLVVLCVAPALGQVPIKERRVPAYDKYVIEVGPGDPVRFIPHTPYDLDIDRRELKDGGYIGIIATGAPGIRIIDAWRNGAPGEMPDFVRVVLRVGKGPEPDPDPDPEPEPELTGLAKQIYTSARSVGLRDDARRIGNAYRSVASQISAGALESLSGALRAITVEMERIGKIDPRWEKTGKLCEAALDKFGQNLLGARDTMVAIADGMEAASK